MDPGIGYRVLGTGYWVFILQLPPTPDTGYRTPLPKMYKLYSSNKHPFRVRKREKKKKKDSSGHPEVRRIKWKLDE